MPTPTIYLPVQAKDVFRLLALRSVVENKELIGELASNFNNFRNGIDTTERLFWEHDPFAYEHKGYSVAKPFDIMTERELCSNTKAFFRKERFEGIGEVIDYEIPLDSSKGSAYGKIDLLSVNGETAYFIEVKRFKSNEHPLRALFEILTFWRMLSKDGKFDCFKEKYKNKERDVKGCKHFTPALLLYKDSGIAKKFEIPDSDEHGRLIRRFFDNDIGMKLFLYDDKLNVCDKTSQYHA